MSGLCCAEWSGGGQACVDGAGQDCADDSGADDALHGIALFDGLERPVRHQVLTLAQPRRYQRGDVVYRAGAPGDELLLLMSGTVALFRARAGVRAVLTVVCPPGMLGDEALSSGQPRFATAEALQEAFALALSVEALVDLMYRYPSIAEAARRYLVRRMAALAEQRADDVLLDLPGRVAKALIGIADHGDRAAAVTLSQQTLAGLARGSRQSVNQVLKSFARCGWVRIQSGRIVLTDVEAVRDRARTLPDGTQIPDVSDTVEG